MNCSKCGGVFEEIEYSGIKCNRCVSCQGILFSMLDHEHLKGIEGSESIDIGDAQVGKQYNSVHRIACPECATRMIPMVDRDQPHIWYEACTFCYSVFFDAGEFTDFKEKTVLDFFRDLLAGERK
ncbi:MAG: zf-TFIIB domain-containing protein [Pseudomonadales bacterium]|jgi:Zn-finger nucleic acid-binding protein|nr:zf-TFIIB domain-containing protein [Pseudomonadales bacterium]